MHIAPLRTSILAIVTISLMLGMAIVAAMGATPARADAQVASIALGQPPNDIVIDSTGTYGYVVSCASPASVSRIQLSSFTVDDSMVLSGSCAFDTTLVDDSLYVTTSDRLYRFNTATFGTSTDDSVAIHEYGASVAVQGGVAYVGHVAGSHEHQITKINVNTSPMSVVTTFASGGTYPVNLKIDPAGTHMYVVHTMSHSLTKIRLSDDSVLGSVSVGQQPYGLGIDDTGTYAYVPSASRETWDSYYTPPWLVRVDLASFTVDDTVTLPFYWGYSVAVDNARGTVYVGQAREGGRIAKVGLGGTMSLTETFTVDNGPSALALSPTAPYLYSANPYDGQNNTVSKIAIMAPAAPTTTSMLPVSGPATGGTSVTIAGADLAGATVRVNGAVVSTTVNTATTIEFVTPASAAGSVAVTVTTGGGTVTAGTFTFDSADPPAPVTPSPVLPTPPVAPVAVIVSGTSSADITWQAPAEAGSYPVSTYLVTSSPGGRTCMTAALSCRVHGLTPGTAYTFTVKALTGAGWSPTSPASNVVTPVRMTITISGVRDGRRITISGSATGLEAGAIVRAWVKLAGQRNYVAMPSDVLVSEGGNLEWARRASRSTSIYLQTTDGTVRSNTVVVAAR
jgi:DNA-binding beta-propeller fold protein YncE